MENKILYEKPVYYISDLHLQHENILRMGRDCFSSIEEHDQTIIENWKRKIKDDDVVYVLGDITTKVSFDGFRKLIVSLPGHKHLIVGNHDWRWMEKNENRQVLSQFESVNQLLTINDCGKRVTLCHYPLAEWPYYYNNGWHVFGHIHNSRGDAYSYMQLQDRALNACVDINNYEPCTIDELIKNNEMYKL